MATVVNGLIEGTPSCRQTTDTAGEIRIVANQTFGGADTIKIEYGIGNLDLSTTPIALTTGGKGTAQTITLTGLAANSRYNYRLVLVVSGETSNSDVYQLPLRAGTTTPVTCIFTSDLHGLRGEREAIGEDTLPAFLQPHPTARVDLFDKGYSHILAEVGIDGSLPSFRFDLGDSYSQVKLQSGSNIFSINEDGTSQGGADKSYAKNQTDADYAVRLNRKRDVTLGSIPLIVELIGNHNAGHAFMHDVASVPGGNTLGVDTGAWARTASDTYLGRPDATGIYGGSSDGRYGSVQIGPCLWCWMDPYHASQLSVTSPDTFPQTYDSINDWTIGSAQFDYFFHATTGVITNNALPWIVVMVHNLTGGRATGSPTNYGRGGIAYGSNKGETPAGEWASTSAWRTADPYTYSTGNVDLHTYGIHRSLIRRGGVGNVIVFHGHDHQFVSEETVDGVPYIEMPRLSGSQYDVVAAGPYSAGHESAVLENYPESTRGVGNLKSRNAGYVIVDVTLATFAIKYRRSVIQFPNMLHVFARSPTDWTGSDGEIDHSVTLTKPATAVNSIVDSFDRIVEEDITWVVAGSNQNAIPIGEAAQATTELGPLWENYSEDGVAFLAVRVSDIDGIRALSTRRPITAGTAAKWQGIRRKFGSVNRVISCKTRAQGGTKSIRIQVGGQAADPTSAASGFGIYLDLKLGGPTQEMRLRMDDGAAITNMVTTAAELDYIMPNNTSFDAGVKVSVEDKQIVVSADDGTGSLTERINYTMTQAQWDWYVSNGDHVGLVGVTDNITSSGFVHEFRDFSATVQAEAVTGRSRTRARIR